ncbi:MAG: hypothetical protein HUJ31_14300, partial [Pseudomonadales bacterium]|nr:hypothetical protein [Pseudomonadales bacterium]
EEESLLQGECFVFDNRVTVKHNLEEGDYDQCHACRMPVSESDRQSEHYVPGVSCPHCADRYTPEQRERFRERERQVAISEQRGEAHLGADGAATQAERRKLKKTSRHK